MKTTHSLLYVIATTLAIAISLIQIGCGEGDGGDNRSTRSDGVSADFVKPGRSHEEVARNAIEGRIDSPASVFGVLSPERVEQMAGHMARSYTELLSKGKDHFINHAETVNTDKARIHDQLKRHLERYEVDGSGKLPKHTDDRQFIFDLYQITGGIEKDKLEGSELVAFYFDRVKDEKAYYRAQLRPISSEKKHLFLIELEQIDGLWYLDRFTEITAPTLGLGKPPSVHQHR